MSMSGSYEQGYAAGHHGTEASLDSMAWGNGLTLALRAFERGFSAGEGRRETEEAYAADHPVVLDWRGADQSECAVHCAGCGATSEYGMAAFSCSERCQQKYEHQLAMCAAQRVKKGE